MNLKKPTVMRRSAALAGLGALMITSTIGLTTSVASADVYTSYNLSFSPTAPVAPRFFEGYSSTDRVAGSETAVYALSTISDYYGAAGVFGCPLDNDKRTCSGSLLPQTDIYDNFDHVEINQDGTANGSVGGSEELCASSTTSVNANDGLPVNFTRASASLTQLANHATGSTCPTFDESQAQIATSAVVGVDFANVVPSAYYGTATTNPVPAGFTLTAGSGTGNSNDIAWRIFCDSNADSGAKGTVSSPPPGTGKITNWDELGGGNAPIVLWSPSNSSGTGADFFDYAGCGTTTGNVPNVAGQSNHTKLTENDTDQIPEYASEDCYNTENPGSPVTSGVIGTSKYTQTVEACVATEVADSLFFMDYGYTSTHPNTVSLELPDFTQGNTPSWINDLYDFNNGIGSISSLNGSAWEIEGTNTEMDTTGGVTVPVTGANEGSLASTRGLYLDYLPATVPVGDSVGPNPVTASSAGFINYVCDAGNQLYPKGVDQTTGVPFDTEIHNAIADWGWQQDNCDQQTTSGGVTTFTGPQISSAVTDPANPQPGGLD
jgi:hypothetical protein